MKTLILIAALTSGFAIRADDQAQDIVNKVKKSNASEKILKAEDRLIELMAKADIKIFQQAEVQRQFNGCWNSFGGMAVTTSSGQSATFHQLDNNQLIVDTNEGTFLLPVAEEAPHLAHLSFGTQNVNVALDTIDLLPALGANNTTGTVTVIQNAKNPANFEKIALLKMPKEAADKVHRKIMKRLMGEGMETLLIGDTTLKQLSPYTTEICTKASLAHTCGAANRATCDTLHSNLVQKCEMMKSDIKAGQSVLRVVRETIEKLSKACGEFLTADENTAVAQFLEKHPDISSPATTTRSAESIQ